MEEILNHLIITAGSFFTSITGFVVPPVIIVIGLIIAIAKGMKTLMKIACAVLVIYVVWMMIQAGIIPIAI